MKRRSVLLFFALPFAGVLVFFVLSSALAQADLKRRTESLVRDQLTATSAILRATVSHFLEEGRPPAEALDAILAEGDIYFVALLDAEEKSVLAWNSRYEGYLPISLHGVREGASGIIDSPAGKILSLMSAVPAVHGRSYLLYVGYALGGMEEMLAQSRRASYLIAGLILLAGALFFRGLFQLQTRYVTKAREAETERQEKERFREISAFTSGVAHEIKNPLNSLALLFELLERKAPPDVKGDLNLGKSQVRVIARTVDRFSRVVKAVQPSVEPLSVDELFRRVADSLVAEVPEAAARLRIGTAPDVRLAGDRELLSQALLNVVKNAVEASPGGPVHLTGLGKGKTVEIAVRDEGPGLSPEARDRVFEPFYTTKEKGMGIGLFLTRRIVEAHGGKIKVLSPAGGGAEFRIELPGA